jgi:hypothetical protein
MRVVFPFSQEKQKALEHEPSMYNVGWSHGKEKLGDTPDFAKGSFYANPLYDEPGTPVCLVPRTGLPYNTNAGSL